MPLSQFTKAKFDADGNINVNGPFKIAQGEDVEVTCLHFMLTQGEQFAAGTGTVDVGATNWDGVAKLANNLTPGEPTQAVGIAVLFATVQTSAGPRSGPQVYSWSHAIDLEPHG